MILEIIVLLADRLLYTLAAECLAWHDNCIANLIFLCLYMQLRTDAFPFEWIDHK